MESLETRLRSREPLWGRWQLGERIYRSSNCSVYVLTCDRLDEPLESVVKVVPLAGFGDELEAKLQLVLDEIHAMEQLRDCANVVTLYDDRIDPLYSDDGELAGYDVLIRMERLTCLSDLLREGETLPTAEVRRLAQDLCGALSAAHRRGIFHRDIKPANIYRTAGGTYQLGDFSVARQTQTGVMETMTGTAAYMAPEVARGDAYDGRADLYSLGIVLYQLLNDNYLPLTGESTSQSQREAALRQRWSGSRLPLPPSGGRPLRQAVARCCSADPRRRYPSADAMRDALCPPGIDRFWIPAAAVGWFFAIVATVALLILPRYVGRLAPETTPAASASDSEADTLTQETDLSDGDEAQETVTHRYTVVQAQMTWDDARVYCESRGGHLATVLDQEQFDTVAALLEESGISQAWLGASDLNSSNGFQWVTGDDFDFAVWALGEPNHTNNIEHYLMMYQKEGQGWVWNDSHSEGMWMFPATTCGFVCQWDETNG